MNKHKDILEEIEAHKKKQAIELLKAANMTHKIMEYGLKKYGPIIKETPKKDG